MTKPQQELIAADNLQRQQYGYYCPRYLQPNKRPNKPPFIRPLFPRYIFVFIEQTWYSLLGTRGISRVLMGEQAPQPIADSVIHELKRRENKQGLVQLGQPLRFAVGDRVKATEGPLEGHLMIYEGMSGKERAKVLANLLGRSVYVEMEEKLLIAA